MLRTVLAQNTQNMCTVFGWKFACKNPLEVVFGVRSNWLIHFPLPANA